MSLPNETDFFSLVYSALISSNIESKREITTFIYENLSQLEFIESNPINALEKPSYSELCEVIHPTRIKRPKSCDSKISLAKVLHTIAHIEFSAIDLALDACYRFRGMPFSYYMDFIEIACEEISHFSLIESILHELGFNYGSFAVHDNLFMAMQRSDNVIERMALVHKGLEALGLDANPFVAKKIESSKLEIKDKILNVLDIILRDEITHVKKGGKWLLYAQDIKGDKRNLAEILESFRDFNLLGRQPNIEARLKAGYTKEEIEMLASFAR